MQKPLKTITLFLLIIIFSFTIDLPQANAAYTCGGSPRCVATNFTYGQAQYVSSGSIYFTKGEIVAYEWQNDSPGIMQVGFSIHKGGVRVSRELLAVRGGVNFATFTIPSNGNYYLFAACEGGSDKRCHGGGTLKKF